MARKIKQKKQLNKYADAARLLHPDYVYLWVDEHSNLVLSTIEPEFSDSMQSWFASGYDFLIMPEAVNSTVKLADSLIQLRTETRGGDL